MSALHFGAIRLNDVQQEGFAYVAARDHDKKTIYVVTSPATTEERLPGSKNTVSVDVFADVYTKIQDGSYLLKEKDLLSAGARFFADGQNTGFNPVAITEREEQGHRIWIKA
ncbi:MAG TPA: hypothetical protein V6C52_04915 [Coleofasciculaceae cyanobacterium]|jgi:hypothetical protein